MKRKKLFTLECMNCKASFETKRLKRKFCSQSCSARYNMRLKSERSKVTKECVACGEQFSVIKFYAKQKTCSPECMYSLKRKGAPAKLSLICKFCGQAFVVSYKYRNQKYCDRSCASKNSWNRGLTKETSKKLRQVGEKGSKTKAERICSGEYDPMNRGKRSWHHSQKTGMKHLCRSTYEAAYLVMLDRDSNVGTYETESLRIEYRDETGSKRNYVPDVLVHMLDNKKLLVEVKPSGLVNYGLNPIKQVAAREWCDRNDATFIIVTEKELELSE